MNQLERVKRRNNYSNGTNSQLLSVKKLLIIGFIASLIGIVDSSAQSTLTITSSGSSGPTSGTNWTINSGVLTVTGNASIQPSVITNYLSTTGNLTIQGSNSVNISNSISYSGNIVRTLTIKAINEITISLGVTISSTSAAMNLILWSATDESAGDVFFGATSTYTSPVTISTKGGHLWIGGGASSTTWNGLTVGNGYTIGGMARTVGGSYTHYNGVTLQSTGITTDGGDILIKCKGKTGDFSSTFSGGMYIVGTGTMNSGGGDIEIDAIAQSGTGQKYGFYNLGPAYTFSAGNGALTIKGDASAASSTSSNTTGHGILLWSTESGSQISTSGNITLIGKKATQSGNTPTYGIYTKTSISTSNGTFSLQGDNNIYLTSPLSATNAINIDGNLTLGSTITLGMSNLVLSNGSTISGAPLYYLKTNSTGKVKRSIANGAFFTFPVGNSYYNPVTITNKTGSSDDFSVRVLDEIYANGESGSLISINNRVKRTWDISKTVANANSGNGVDMTFNWTANSTHVNGTLSVPKLYHFENSIWVKKSTISNTTYNVSGGTLNFSGYKGDFSPFAIMDDGTALPVTWQSFNAEKFSEKVTLKWATGSEQNTKDFVVMHSTDAANWNVLGSINAAGNSNTTRIYTFDHVNPLKNNIFNYYRIKQQDLDGQYSYSKIVSIVYDQTASDCMAYPNPAINKLTIYVSNNQEVRLINQAGVTVWKESLTAGRHEVNISHLPKGIYLLQTLCFTNKILIQ